MLEINSKVGNRSLHVLVIILTAFGKEAIAARACLKEHALGSICKETCIPQHKRG